MPAHETPTTMSQRFAPRLRSKWDRLRDLGGIIGVWLERARQRRALAELDDRLLCDIGLTRSEAEREAAKPFWYAGRI